MNPTTPPDDKAWDDYAEHFRTNVFPELVRSAAFVSITGTETLSTVDVKCCTELGAMLLIDKPLILIVPVGATAPTRLAKAADFVVADFDPTDRGSQERLSAVMADLRARGLLA